MTQKTVMMLANIVNGRSLARRDQKCVATPALVLQCNVHFILGRSIY